LLGIGIFLMPYIFAWFTLRSGYSTRVRAVSIGWAAFVILFIVIPSEIRDAHRSTNVNTINTSATANTANAAAVNAAATTVPSASPTPKSFAELKKEAEDTVARYKKNPDSVSGPAAGAIATDLMAVPAESKDYATAQALRKRLIAIQGEIAANDPGPKPVNSAWDGSVRPAENYLKQALNDYSSSEYLGWTVCTKVRKGKKVYWETTVRLKAKNAFGAYIVKNVTFWIQDNQVVEVKGLS
jgi:hypothetical protein